MRIRFLVALATSLLSVPVVPGNDLYFGGKSVLRCSTIEEIAEPKRIEWYHNDELIYVAELQTQRNGLNLLSHTPSESWGGRALFNPKTNSLHLARLTPQDAGVYTCRVVGNQDAVNETFHIRGPMKVPEMRVVSKSLDVVVNITAQSIGPLREDETVDFFCDADPSYPQARVMWFAINEDLQYSSLTMPEQGHSHLRIERLSRRHDGIRFSCRADDKLTGERRQSNTVKLDIYFKPLGITTSNNKILYARENAELECVVSGSRPPPLISWTFGNKKMMSTFIHTSFNGNVTTTSVSFEPRPEHHGIPVSCQAKNPAFPDDVLVETWNLIVHYAPIVDLYPCFRSAQPIPQENQNEDQASFIFKSSGSLCLRCTILANPAPSSIRWFLANEVIAANLTSAILRIDPPLSKKHEGAYTCDAQNSVAGVSSSPVQIRIQEVEDNLSQRKEDLPLRPGVSVLIVLAVLVTSVFAALSWKRMSTKKRGTTSCSSREVANRS